MMYLRILVGSILLIIYGLIFSGTVDWFEGFIKGQTLIFKGSSIGIDLVKAKTGIIFIYLMAIVSVYLISFETEKHKIILGYFMAFLVFCVFFAFG